MTDSFLLYQLSQLCQNAIQTCPFTNAVAGADCTNKFCNGFPAYIGVGTCVSLNYDPRNCCASSDPTTCLENFAHGSGSGSGVSNVCASVISILEVCFTLTPSLSPSAALATSGPSATALASCACYDSDGTYDPSAFDGYASECQASGSAAHPTYFPLVTPLVGFCTNNAGAAVPGSAAASTTSSPAAAASASITSASGGQSPTPATGAGTGTAPSATSPAPATTSKSGGTKITLRTSAILLLGFGMLFSFH